MTKLIVIEGQHGAGKSTQADALATSLRLLHDVDVAVWHHKAPTDAPTPYVAALEYAQQRARLLAWCAREGPDVLVVDRWWHSTEVVGWTRREERIALWRLVSAERVALPPPLLTVLLDATDATLRARIEARGAVETDVDRDARPRYRDATITEPWGAVTVDTEGDPAETTARLAAMALARLDRFEEALGLWHKSHAAMAPHTWLGLTLAAYAAGVERRRCVWCGHVAFPGCCAFTRRAPGSEASE